MNLPAMQARIKRLEQLYFGFFHEIQNIKEGDHPLLLGERREYLKGIQDALSGVEMARVALAKAVDRLRNQ